MTAGPVNDGLSLVDSGSPISNNSDVIVEGKAPDPGGPKTQNWPGLVHSQPLAISSKSIGCGQMVHIQNRKKRRFRRCQSIGQTDFCKLFYCNWFIGQFWRGQANFQHKHKQTTTYPTLMGVECLFGCCELECFPHPASTIHSIAAFTASSSSNEIGASQIPPRFGPWPANPPRPCGHLLA